MSYVCILLLGLGWEAWAGSAASPSCRGPQKHQATCAHDAEEPKAGVLLVNVFFSCEDETGAQRLPDYAYLDLCTKCLQVLWEKLTDGSDS